MEFIFSFVQRTMLRTLIQVYTGTGVLVSLTRNATAAYADTVCECRTDAAVALRASISHSDTETPGPVHMSDRLV